MSQTIKRSGEEDSQHADSPMFSTKRSEKQMSTKRSERSLTDLPSNIIVRILARLPLRTLFIAKSVCKTFSLLTTPNPHFNILHSSNAAPILIFHFGEFSFRRIPSFILRFYDKELQYKKSDLKPLFQLPKLGTKRHRALFWKANCLFLVNSCNGLLLFLHRGLADFRSSIVCNPVTNEYIIIPEVPGSLTRSMWLGYTPATDQYKLLRIFCWSMDDPGDEVLAQVSAIGSDSWRYIDGTPPQRPHFHRDTPAALVNEVMYWHHWSWSDLLSFDFEGEKFRGIAFPPEFQEAQYRRGHFMTIGVLGGCLCLSCNDSYGYHFDLWVLRKCGSWIKKFVFDTCGPVWGYFRPLQFLQNGKILMLLEDYGLICYNPRSKTLRCFGLNKNLKLDYRVVALTPSFVPLKDTLKVENVLSGLRPRYIYFLWC